MAIKQLENSLQAVFEAIDDGIYMTDANGTCIACNSAFALITGIECSDVLHKHVSWLIENNLISDAVTLETIQKKQHVTKMIKYPSGCDALVTGNPVFGPDGNLVAVVCTIKDLTELNALREELELSKKLAQRYRESLQQLKAGEDDLFGGLIVRDPCTKRVLDLIEQVAQSDATVLIYGESGVGKGLVAELIHKKSKRSGEGEFVKIDCGAIPETLLESELFGYEPGAFTGARKEGKVGLIELAERGTLFLDEIAELPLSLQVKLLNVLQDRRIMRVGGVKSIKIDVRIIAATNKDLEKMVIEGTFREDLFYRLNVVPVYIPPLRERKQDILALAAFFLKKYNQKYGKAINISSEFLDCLLEYPWPGNVRELENTIERLVVLAFNETAGLEALPPKIKAHLSQSFCFFPKAQSEIKSLRATLSRVEKEAIKYALAVYPTLKTSAQALGIDLSTLIRKCKKYGISTNPEFRKKGIS